MKYSDNFEKDYAWYLKFKDVFNFDGSLDKTFPVDEYEGFNAKHCFYIYDSTGKTLVTSEPRLLSEIFKCKGSINFNIKLWAEDRAKGILPKKQFKEIIKEFELLPWMIEAVEKQKYKYYECKRKT